MMAISALSKQSKRVGPEELLRRSFITYMIKELGFPSSSILKEKSLSSLSLLLPEKNKKLPLRRVDIAVTVPCKKQGLGLLLVVECKMDAFFESALAQLQGYHYHLLSPFIWIVSEKRSCILFWKEKQQKEGKIRGEYVPFNGTPSYAGLIDFFKTLE